jgi:hypothetical protein
VSEAGDHFTRLGFPTAGEYELRFAVTPGVLLDQFGL